MASLILRKDTWHMIWHWRGRKKFRSTGVKHDGKSDAEGQPIPPVEARRELRKLENSLDQGKTYDTKSLSELLELVEQEYIVNGNDSLASLRSRLPHIRDWFGNMRGDRIVEQDFIAYAAHRQRTKHAANNTINRELEVILHALRLGKVHPLPTLKKLKAPPPRQGFFDDATVRAITAKLPEYLRAPVLFGYFTGWRREEVFGLEWSMVDFAAGEVRLWDSKNETARVFPMQVVSGLRPLLEEQVAKRDAWQRDGHLVPWVFPHYRKTKNTVRRIVDFRKAMATAAIKAGYPRKLFHDLRRSAARNLEMAGWPRSMVMAWTGHKTDAMFLRYRIQSAADHQVVQRMMAILDAGSKAVASAGETTGNSKIIKGNF